MNSKRNSGRRKTDPDNYMYEHHHPADSFSGIKFSPYSNAVKDLTGVKHDKEKRRWALLPWRELGKVADVMTHGVKKYSEDNWMYVVSGERRYFEAAMRHIQARQCGEINDPESKLPHLAHAVCCLLFWMWFDHQNRRGHQ